MTRTPLSRRAGRPPALIALGAAAALALTACGGGQSAEEAAGGEEPGEDGAASESPFACEYDGEEVSLSYWNGFTGGDGPFMEDLVARFNEEHENIEITSNTIQWSDFYQRVPAAVQAGEGPDVGVMHLDQLATHAVRDLIVPVDDVVAGAGLEESDFTSDIWEAGLYDGARYGLPLDVHSLAMYYNTEHFEKAGITEPPTDQESLMAALDKLQAAGYDNPFWMPTLWPAHLMWLSTAWQNGTEIYSTDPPAANFGDEGGVEALQWMRSLVDEGYSPSDVAIDSQYVAFKNGETSITWDGIWQINDLEASETPYGIAPIPVIGDEPAVWANSHQFFITSQAAEDEDRLAASKTFLCWMSENSAEWAGSGMIPARLSAREGDALSGMPQEVIAAEIESMRFLPPVPGLGGVQAETLEPAVAESVLGTGEPEQNLSEAAQSATQLMERNAEQFGG